MTRDEQTIYIESRLSWMRGYLEGIGAESPNALACLDSISETVHTRISDDDLVEECIERGLHLTFGGT